MRNSNLRTSHAYELNFFLIRYFGMASAASRLTANVLSLRLAVLAILLLERVHFTYLHHPVRSKTVEYGIVSLPLSLYPSSNPPSYTLPVRLPPMSYLILSFLTSPSLLFSLTQLLYYISSLPLLPTSIPSPTPYLSIHPSLIYNSALYLLCPLTLP